MAVGYNSGGTEATGEDMQVFTIGYQGRRLDELTQTLQKNDVDIVLDVREYAWSRKPGFSKGQLKRALEDAGIDYLHDSRLGSPLDLRKAYRAGGEWAQFRLGYIDHLGSLIGLIGDYVSLLSGRRVCLLCFEGEASLCHRSLIADAFEGILASTPCHL